MIIELYKQLNDSQETQVVALLLAAPCYFYDVCFVHILLTCSYAL